MKKLIQVLAIALLLVVLSPVQSSANVTDKAATGVYNIELGKEQYFTKAEFKSLPKSEKRKMFIGTWYIINAGTVFPLGSLLLPTEELMAKAIKEAEFKEKNKVQIDSTGEITHGEAPSEDDFIVEKID